jgi:Lon protease-like protein
MRRPERIAGARNVLTWNAGQNRQTIRFRLRTARKKEGGRMNRIPLFPLGLVLLPGMSLPLHIFEERYKLMISECLAADTPFGLVFFDGRSIRSIGCMARVYRVLHRYEDGRMDILTRGEQRFFIHETIEEKPYMEAQVVFFDDEAAPASENPAEVLRNAHAALRQMEDAGLPEEIMEEGALTDPRELAFAIAALEGFSHEERQRFLEMTSTAERLQKCVEVLGRIAERARLTIKIQKIIGGNGHPPDTVLKSLHNDKDH